MQSMNSLVYLLVEIFILKYSEQEIIQVFNKINFLWLCVKIHGLLLKSNWKISIPGILQNDKDYFSYSLKNNLLNSENTSKSISSNDSSFYSRYPDFNQA